MNITNHHVSILITMLNQFSKFAGELFIATFHDQWPWSELLKSFLGRQLVIQ